MEPSLAKMSEKIRENLNTRNALDRLLDQIRNAQFGGDRGAKKLPSTEDVFYARSGGAARVFFRYSDKIKTPIEIIAESNKKSKTRVIDLIK